LFAALDVPRPLPWPECGFPAVVKPSEASGSEAVSVVGSAAELGEALAALERGGHVPVVQELVAGPSLSLEVIAARGRAFTLLPTALEFDAGYDCKRVTAPVECAPEVLASLDEAGRRLAHGVGLDGLMDVEVMVRGLEPKVIEIDARLPSQTPTAVYHCCGVNMVQLLVELLVEGREPQVDLTPKAGVVYQHVRAIRGAIEVVGEHALAHARPLARRAGFFGASEVLTDYVDGAPEWVATMIFRREDLPAARCAAASTLAAIATTLHLDLVEEVSPFPSGVRA
jgi:pyrrolysine biosynthesis protein PylC